MDRARRETPQRPAVRDPRPPWARSARPLPDVMLMQNQPKKIVEADEKMDQKQGVHSLKVSKQRFSGRRRGFSLIEILVAVSIIGLLLGIGATVAVSMTGEARREQTRAMMNGLLSANDEYKAVRQGSSISHVGPFNGETLSSTERFVASCLQIKTCEEIMLSALNSSGADTFKRIYRNGGGSARFSVYDRWGTEIEYRQSNDQTGNGPANEKGDTVANSDLPLSRDPFFASAGPDKLWGTDDDITTLQN